MTWRERIVEARARGKFNYNDLGVWGLLTTCPAGEACLAAGLRSREEILRDGLPDDLFDLGQKFGLIWDRNDLHAAECLLDAIEDRALALKRESFASPASRSAERDAP